MSIFYSRLVLAGAYPTSTRIHDIKTHTHQASRERAPANKDQDTSKRGKGSTQMVAIWRPANRVCVNHCCFDRKKWESDIHVHAPLKYRARNKVHRHIIYLHELLNWQKGLYKPLDRTFSKEWFTNQTKTNIPFALFAPVSAFSNLN